MFFYFVADVFGAFKILYFIICAFSAENQIKRMKEEGKRLLEEEQQRCRKQQFEARQRTDTNVASHPSKSDSNSEGFRLKVSYF